MSRLPQTAAVPPPDSSFPPISHQPASASAASFPPLTPSPSGGRVDFWTCVNFSTYVNQDFTREFCRQLIQTCVSKGMVFNENPILPIQSAHPSQIERVLVDVSKQANKTGKQLQLLIIILPDSSGSYGKIKRVCETELGIISQCCQPRQASKLSKQYFENVALKINVKVCCFAG